MNEVDLKDGRKIIHVDMDAFYASVAQRDDPDLRGKPVAVGGSSNRGVVMAASYEARKFGVRSAMPSVTAKRRCPDLIFVKSHFDVYRDVSHQIRDIFKSFTDMVEPLGLDEAYLDVTERAAQVGSATDIAREIRALILKETQLTASAGVSFNKFLAKIASDFNKPDGLTVVRPDQVDRFIGGLPIGSFYGVGKVTAEKFRKLGVNTGADLRKLDEEFLKKRFGKSGGYYYRLARGIDYRKVSAHRRRKSIGAERTSFEDSSDHEELLRRLDSVLGSLWSRIEKSEAAWRTVTVKIKYHDFVQTTRSKTLDEYCQSEGQLRSASTRLLETPEWPVRPVRLLGVSVSNLRFPGDPVEEGLVDGRLFGARSSQLWLEIDGGEL